MTENAPSISTGNTTVTTERLMQVVAAINTNKMYAKDRTRELQAKKKEIIGSDLPPVAFAALWRMRKLSDKERDLVVKAVSDYGRHLGGNAFKTLQSIDDERLEASADVRSAKQAAKDLGVNIRALDMALKIGQLDEVEREEMFNDVDRYGAALRYW